MDLSVIEKVVLKSLTTIVDLFISSFSSINCCFIYFASCILTVALGERISCIPVTSLCLEVEASY